MARDWQGLRAVPNELTGDGTMNAINVLESQQGDLEDLFHEISGAKDEATKRLILDEIADKLAVLAAFEAHVLRRAASASPLVRDGLRASVERMGELVADLRGATVGAHETSDAKVAALQEEVERQLDEAETQLLPKLGATLGDEGLWTLGVELIAIRRAFESRAEQFPSVRAAA
jgi:hypothetical protein